jgi:pimeloyl-ACP methyl ester carboxylesterase
MRNGILTFLLVFSTVFFIHHNALAQEKKVVYDAVLSQYSYPFPEKYLELKLEGEDCRMAYMDVFPQKSNEGKPVVLLLHGKNFFGAYWANTIKFLTEAGYRVIVPDQVGFGKSTKANLHYSFHQLARNTKKLLDTLGVQKVTVVGHSMGGMLATRFALEYPETVQKLVLENPIGLEDYRTGVPFQSVDEAYAKELKTTAESIRNYHNTYYPAWRAAFEEWVNVPAAQLNSPDYQQVAMASALTYEMIYQQPVCYEFRNLKVPTLLIIGQEDRTVVGKALIKDNLKLAQMGNYPKLGKQTAKAIPKSDLLELPGVGHIPHLEAPDKFHSALLMYLGVK